ncbi:MAG: DUF1611 domain-containing protein [Gammaproteobacteria bacterium]|nr:DUF1611 domain-containing protein [Gammaproteobacteria bacterium]MDH3429968.1 DUF1611 domain-containing protein [Gammaproteobacteria bacterium]MDH3481334.1 DUF1611 domain-containing protein [Gammaproteobacteria bacterium]
MGATTRTVRLRPPYLVFIGDQQDPSYAKTGFGLVDWRRELVAGQLRFGDKPVDLGVPDMDVEAAVAAGAKSLLIGVASVGGVIPDEWWNIIVAAANKGLDIVSGLHGRLADNSALAAAARESGALLVDVRRPPPDLPVGSGRKRSGKRVLMLGTDCAVGKKYSALALTESMKALGADATFRATGQTGIMIAGEGIAIDAVVADFVAGAAELVSPDNDDDHWDVIEGQGSLSHPGYSGVSLGLLHGSQPDAIVVCHDAMRTSTLGWPDYPLPTIAECRELGILLGRRTNPAVYCAGISVNTSELAESARGPYLKQLSADMGLPCVDPVADGCEAIARRLLVPA